MIKSKHYTQPIRPASVKIHQKQNLEKFEKLIVQSMTHHQGDDTPENDDTILPRATRKVEKEGFFVPDEKAAKPNEEVENEEEQQPVEYNTLQLDTDALSTEQVKSTTEPPYTIFSAHERYVLMMILSLVGFWCTISSPIYFPALPTLTRYFHSSEATMNLSVVAYLIFQGVAPAISSNIADYVGTRPMLLVSLAIFVVSCIAIAKTNVYWLLVVLRCVQAAGIAPVFSISAGVSGHVCTASDRGGFVGFMSGFQLVGNGFGGLVGAALISLFNSWRSIFYFLAIGGGATLVFAILLLPETSRLIVGNGSIPPSLIFHKLVMMYLPHFSKKLTKDFGTLLERKKFDLLAPIKILVQPICWCTLLPSGLGFAAWTVVLTSLSTELESSAYNYSVMHVGLAYLPQGLLCLVSSIVTGNVLNRYYAYRKRLHAEKYKDCETKPKLNMVRARLDLCIVPIALNFMGLLIFGWCLQFHKSVGAIIVSSILVSTAATSFMSMSVTLMVDMFPGRSNAATSCLNLVRCLLAALFTGVLDNMITSLNLGGAYTLICGLCVLSYIPFGYMIYRYGILLNT